VWTERGAVPVLTWWFRTPSQRPEQPSKIQPGLVMRRSSVRIRQGAPWKTSGQDSDLGFLVLGDLGIRADRVPVGYASQCVGPGSTASGRFGSQSCDLDLCPVPPVGFGLSESAWWPCRGRACSGCADGFRSAARSQAHLGPQGCGVRTIARSMRSAWGVIDNPLQGRLRPSRACRRPLTRRNARPRRLTRRRWSGAPPHPATGLPVL
jgi:hypothetical protein